MDESPRTLLNSNPNFFRPFSLVIGTQVGAWVQTAAGSWGGGSAAALPCSFGPCSARPSRTAQTCHPAPAPPLPQLGEADAEALDKTCREHGVRLLLLRSYGLLG